MQLWLCLFQRSKIVLNRYFLSFRSHRVKCDFFFPYMDLIDITVKSLCIKIQIKLQNVTRKNKIYNLCPGKKDCASLSGKSNSFKWNMNHAMVNRLEMYLARRWSKITDSGWKHPIFASTHIPAYIKVKIYPRDNVKASKSSGNPLYRLSIWIHGHGV